jgi:hypothetical protein
MRKRMQIASAILTAIPALAAAHHSAAPFDQQTVVALEGVVSKYEWTNPHIYLHLDVRNASGAPATWKIESGSPAVMRVRGWTKESFAVGDRVRVEVNPARDKARTIGLVRSATTQQGMTLAGLGPDAPGSLRPPAKKAESLHGVWVPMVQPPLHQKLRLAPAMTLPVTQKGTEALQGFNERSPDNPAAKCVPPVAPLLMIIPEVKQIEVSGDRVQIRSEGFGPVRTVYLNAAAGASTAASLQGHSTGTWQGGALVVETSRFSDNRVGNAIGLPSGARKHLAERFELSPDGASLKYSFVLQDPDYLKEPVTGDLLWRYRPDLTFSAVACDPENARRFLTE